MADNAGVHVKLNHAYQSQVSACLLELGFHLEKNRSVVPFFPVFTDGSKRETDTGSGIVCDIMGL